MPDRSRWPKSTGSCFLGGGKGGEGGGRGKGVTGVLQDTLASGTVQYSTYTRARKPGTSE